MENSSLHFSLYNFLTDIGLCWGTLWHVHTVVFNMSSNCFQLFLFYFYLVFLNISRATGRPAGRAVRAVRAGGRYGRAGGQAGGTDNIHTEYIQ